VSAFKCSGENLQDEELLGAIGIPMKQLIEKGKIRDQQFNLIKKKSKDTVKLRMISQIKPMKETLEQQLLVLEGERLGLSEELSGFMNNLA